MAVWPVVRMRFVARAVAVKPDFPRNPFPGGDGVRVRRPNGSPVRGGVRCPRYRGAIGLEVRQ